LTRTKIIAALVGLLVGTAGPAFATVTFSPALPNVEQSMTLTLTPPVGFIVAGSPRWDFGDGTSAVGLTTATKTYNRVATFTVTVNYQYQTLGSGFPATTSESVSVTVIERRRIVFTPTNPNADQDVVFTAENFFGPGVRWDFGDGSAPAVLSTAATHRFATSGTYTVGVRDMNGASVVTFTAIVNVGENRRVTYVPPSPFVNQTVTFTAVNFLSASVQWDFGDGTAPVVLATMTTHGFGWPGAFTVKARDFGGTAISVITALVTVSVDPARRRIVASPSSPLLLDPVTFTPVNFYTTDIRWDFGDGMAATNQAGAATHVYSVPGTYTVRAWDWNGQFGEPVTTSVTAAVDPARRRIVASPSSPLLLNPVTFTPVNFYTTDIRWDFGDGAAATNQAGAATHVYSVPGTYTARAWDWNGQFGEPVTTSVTAAVDPARRRITVTPPVLSALRPVSFSAVNFYSTDILWDFGDGTPPTMQSTFVSHIFMKPGPYAVQAWDWNGQYGNPAAVSIRVGESAGPRAAFQIFFLQLRFEDGKSYKTVSKEFVPFRAFADIKYEGTGVLQVQWLVDGQAFHLTTQTLALAQETTIDSGAVPPLPTQLAGVHDVTLKINQPQTEFTIPVIRYYVAVASPVRPSVGSKAEIVAESVYGLKGVTCSLQMDTLQIPTGGYFILNGLVKFENGAPLKYGLLRIHLDDELIDQQIVRDLKKNDERRFVTSIHNQTPKAKKIYISLYDITGSEPKLVYLKSLKISPNAK